MKITKILFLLISLSYFFSCGIYEDFTTYFNTYYNATVQYEEALTEVATQEKELFIESTQNQPLPTSSKFVTVIEKCSKILQFNQNSSYVVNALLMIGKSYYYQREYPSSIRKFNELIANFPNSKYNIEARLWLAKSNIKMNEIKLAQTQLEDLILFAQEKNDEDILADAYLELMKIYFQNKDYEKIIVNGNEYLKYYYDSEKASQVVLQMGISYYKLKNYDKAIETLDRVHKYSATYKTKFRAYLEKAKLKRELHQDAEAKEILDDLRDNAIYEEFYDQVEYEYASLFYDQKNYDLAFQKYRLVDTLYGRTESGGLAQFKLGQFVEDRLNNLDSAKYYYDRAASSVAPKEIVALAQRKSQLLTKRKSIFDNISKLKERIDLLSKFVADSSNIPPSPVLIDSTKLEDTVYQVMLKKELSGYRLLDSLYYSRLVKDTLMYQANLKIADSLKFEIAKNNYDLGVLFYSDLELPDSSLNYFKYITESYPKSDLSNKARFALSNYYNAKGDTLTRDSLYHAIYENKFKSDLHNYVAKKLNKELLEDSLLKPKNDFNIAEKEYLNKKYYKAIPLLWKIYKDFGWSDYAPKSMYTIGHIYEVDLKKYDSAAVVYDSLQKTYPSTIYANNIAGRLSVYKQEQAKKEAEKKAEEEKKKLELEAKKQAELKKATEKKGKDSLGIKTPELKLPVIGDSLKIVPELIKDTNQVLEKKKEEEIGDKEK